MTTGDCGSDSVWDFSSSVRYRTAAHTRRVYGVYMGLSFEQPKEITIFTASFWES